MNRIVFRSPFCRLRRHTIVASNSSITTAAATNTTTTTTTNEKTATTHHRFVTTAPSVSGFNHCCVLFDHHYHLSKKTTGLSRCSFSSTSNVASNTTTGGTTTTNDNNSSSSSSSNFSDGLSTEIRSVYVHPLSQVVLEYLQDCRYEWIIEKGLDRSLTLHRDGSFEVKFVVQRPLSLSPPTPSLDGPSDNDNVHQQKNVDENNNNNNIEDKNSNENNDDKNRNTEAAELTSIGDDNKDIMKGTTATATTTTNESSSSTISTSTSHVATTTTDENIRIWTSYDEQEKKHWLTVRKGLFRQRFLLQDNLSMAWNGNRGTSEHIHVAVDEMIRAVDRLESSTISTSTSSQTT